MAAPATQAAGAPLQRITIEVPAGAGLNAVVAAVSRAMIESALRANAGDVQRSARALGLPRKTLYDKCYRLSIDAAMFKPRIDVFGRGR